MTAVLAVLAALVPVAAVGGYLAGIWHAGRRLPVTLAALDGDRLAGLARAAAEHRSRQ